MPVKPPKIEIDKRIPKTLGTQIAKTFTARLGDPSQNYKVAVDSTDKLGLLYIHGLGDTPFSAYTAENRANLKELVPGRLVEVGYTETNRYAIRGVASEDPEFMDGVNLTDQEIILRSQILDGSWYPLDTTTLQYKGTYYVVDGVVYRTSDQATGNLIDGSTDDTSATAIEPPSTATKAIMVLGQINPITDTITYKQSSEFPASYSDALIASNSLLPSPDDGNAPIGYVKLISGVTSLSQEHLTQLPGVYRIGGGNGATIEIDITAGEDLAEHDIAYLDNATNTYFKVDTDATSSIKASGRIVVVSESGGITSASTGTAVTYGELDDFTGLTAGDPIYASATAGGITQTKPNPSLDGSQVAIIEIGYALSTTKAFIDPKRIKYVKSATVSNGSTLTVEHHSDPASQSRDVKTLITAEVAGSVLTEYASSNQDANIQLAGADLAGDSITITASAAITQLGDVSGTERQQGQSFTTSNGGLLTQFTIDFGSNNGSPSGDATWILHNDDSNSPGTTISTGTFTPTPSARSTINLNSTQQAILSASTKYWLTFSVPAQATNNYYAIVTSFPSSVYAGGNQVNSTDGGSTWNPVTADMDMTVTISAISEYERISQGVQVVGSQTVETAELYLKKTGSPADTLTLRLETDNSGDPSGTLVHANATATVSESSLSTSYGFIEFAFAGTFSISGSTQYHFVLSTGRAQSDTDYVSWGADESSPSYADGEANEYSSSAWSALGADMIFKLFGEGTTSVQERSRDTIAVDYHDGSYADADTKTTATNNIGAPAKITLEVTL